MRCRLTTRARFINPGDVIHITTLSFCAFGYFHLRIYLMLLMSADFLNLCCKLSFVDTPLREH
jgi:hypothetical protein